MLCCVVVALQLADEFSWAPLVVLVGGLWQGKSKDKRPGFVVLVVRYGVVLEPTGCLLVGAFSAEKRKDKRPACVVLVVR